MRFRLLLATLFVAAGAASSQSVATPAAEPQINADATVSFRYAAPMAEKVSVSLEGTKAPLPMTRNAAGMWTATTPALSPEYYSYHFEVDGTTQLDARNPIVKASYLGAGNGFLVPGKPAKAWEVTAVPHGTVHHHTFTSRVVVGLDANQDEYYVYTPPGYDARAATRYPVLYLLHGWSDTASGWTTIGHANDIMDNLIAAGKAKPMIVVMPLGYGDMSFVRSGFGVWNKPERVQRNTTLFAQMLLTEVMPQVESLYNVAPGSKARAIAGLSMGGLESLTIGLTNPDKFAYVGGFSSAVHMFEPAMLAAVPKTPAQKLLWVACGTSDDLIEPNRRLTAALAAGGFPVTPIETPGAHTWLVWRDNLVTFVPLLFKN